MEPALNRDSSAEVEFPGKTLVFPASLDSSDDALKGLVDGVGLDVLGKKDGRLIIPGPLAPGENFEGTVPALPRRCGPCAEFSGGGIKSGKPS